MLLVSVVDIDDHNTTSCYGHQIAWINGYSNDRKRLHKISILVASAFRLE